MTRLESKKTDVSKAPKEIFDFLSDFNNFQKLMPPQVVDWQSTAEDCSFTITGMAALSLKFESKTPNSEIVMIKNGKAPFDLKLITQIKEKGGASEVQIFLDADLNPFLKMMAEKPLTNFLNMLADKLSEIS